MKNKKKILYATLGGIGIFLLSYAALQYTDAGRSPLTSETPNSLFAPSNFSTSSAELLSLDSDADGLADWEEVLWKSDPQKKDTDGDGTSDGEEIRLNRNPAVRGPNDKLENLPASSVGTKSDDELTPTEKLSRDVLDSYLKLKQSSEGTNVSAPSLQTLLNKNQVPISASTYTAGQFKTTDDSTESVVAYRTRFLAVFQTYFPSGDQEELRILHEALQKESAETFATLGAIATQYDLAVKDLRSLGVPPGALTLHVGLVNSLSRIAASIRAMGKMYTDPVTGLSGVNTYQEASSAAVGQLVALGAYFGRVTTQSTVQ